MLPAPETGDFVELICYSWININKKTSNKGKRFD
jgi:hypothetical protein